MGQESVGSALRTGWSTQPDWRRGSRLANFPVRRGVL